MTTMPLLGPSPSRYSSQPPYPFTSLVLRIRLPGNTFGAKGYAAGLFCWVHVPGVSALEWHPFSISSSPSLSYGEDGVVEFSILNMGEGTWTGNLAKYAQEHGPTISASKNHGASSAAATDISELTHIALDGPFGRAIDYSRRSTIILVAGGIGVTPMISILAEIAARRRDPGKFGDAGAVQNVFFVWSIRHEALCQAFAHILEPIAADAEKLGVRLHVHCSTKKAQAAAVAAPSPDEPNRQPSTNSRASRVSRNISVDSEIEMKTKELSLSTDNWGGEKGGGKGDSNIKSDANRKPIEIAPGRPDMDAIFLVAQSAARQSSGDSCSEALLGDGNYDVATIVCGPPALADSVSTLCFKYRFDFQSEEFVM